MVSLSSSIVVQLENQKSRRLELPPHLLNRRKSSQLARDFAFAQPSSTVHTPHPCPLPVEGRGSRRRPIVEHDTVSRYRPCGAWAPHEGQSAGDALAYSPTGRGPG